MATSIVIPREGQSMESAIITDWMLKIGDKVEFGQPICEVETEKVSFDIESPIEGTVLDILYSVGDTVPVLKTIAIIGKPNEDYTDLIENKPNEKETKQEVENIQEIKKKPEVEAKITKRILMSPRAKKLALENGVTISGLKGSPITEKDVIEYLALRPKLTPAATDLIKKTGSTLPSLGTGIGGRITVDDLIASDVTGEVIGGMRKTIADRMYQSLQQTAQFTLNCYTEATGLLDLRARLKNSELELSSISINDILLLSVAKTLEAFPALNARFADGRLDNIKEVNLGFAVEVPNGLMVPIIKDAQNLSLKQISEKAKELGIVCKDGSIKQDKLTGGTFTVSNLGAMGIESFTPILNYPEVGILGVGAIALRPVEREGKVEFVNHISLSLTMNHQVIDGAVGARFLKVLSDNLRNIDTLLAL